MACRLTRYENEKASEGTFLGPLRTRQARAPEERRFTTPLLVCPSPPGDLSFGRVIGGHFCRTSCGPRSLFGRMLDLRACRLRQIEHGLLLQIVPVSHVGQYEGSL